MANPAPAPARSTFAHSESFDQQKCLKDLKTEVKDEVPKKGQQQVKTEIKEEPLKGYDERVKQEITPKADGLLRMPKYPPIPEFASLLPFIVSPPVVLD